MGNFILKCPVSSCFENMANTQNSVNFQSLAKEAYKWLQVANRDVCSPYKCVNIYIT
jgi:hypothetical protein